ncbi:hypothetical protein LCGC14_1207540 [marine sediment metagenome]|uniref:XRE family transcriptional regulator n=2 Tax=root TaxID=1 RepID=A0A831QP72_9FLAO|nr:XRE family transcriptional regulator [Pricia antarctica]
MKQPELGNRISELRKAKGLTQEELVERCNISVRTIQRIETGEVNPRSYTVKTILSALESDFDQLHAESSFSGNVPKILTFAWVAGTAYFVLGLLEGPMDMSRAVSGSQIPRETVSEFFPMMTFGPVFYIIVKVLVLIAYTMFLRGFTSIGTYLGNPLLTMVSRIMIMTMAFVVGFDILSFYFMELDGPFVQMAIALSLGALGIVFGITLIALRSKLGAIGTFAGAIEVMAGILLLSLQPFGLIVQIPAVILEIVLVYQVSRAVAEGSDIALGR